MPRAHYYASTVRNLKDVAQYTVYPLFKMLSLMAIKDRHKAEVVAGVATTGFYASLTSYFAGVEADSFDENARRAVAAELGKKPEELKFSDYSDSKNSIVRREVEDFKWVTKARYATDMLPLLPSAVNFASRAIPGLEHLGRYPTQNPPQPNASAMEHLLHGWRLWDNLVYAGKSGYWAYETFAIPKTGHYEIYKLSENIEELKRHYSANDLIGVINRNRNDRKLPMISSKADHEALWPVLEKLAEKLNTSDKFDIPELVYLVGLNKLNIYALDANGQEIRGAHGPVVDPTAISRAMAEIDLIDRIGLDGIGERNRQAHYQAGKAEGEHGFADRIERRWTDTKFETFQALFNLKGRDKHVEYISPRDPTEVGPSVA